MRSRQTKDISITLTSFFMKCVGLWLATDCVEHRRRKYALIYTVIAICIAVTVEIRDLYYSWGNFSERVYIACNILSLVMVLLKLLVLIIHKEQFIYLISHMQENFWNTEYNTHEHTIVDNCRRTCTYLICIFTFFAEGTVFSYIVRPVVENIGKNETDRILPFNMWLNLPLSTTPYFELMFMIQVLSLYHVGLCYFCFDNCLCIMNLHVAGQFRVLQYRLRTLYEWNEQNEKLAGAMSNIASSYYAEKCYERFRSYVQQHQSLLEYCRKVESIFKLIVLGQVLTFSLLICCVGFQVIQEDTPTTRRQIFVFHLLGTLVQLLMFTYSCDCLMDQSTKVAAAAYAGPWLRLPMTESGRSLRRDLVIVMMRSRVPCCLTACGFFPVSLETYTTILSTAVSYFTLLTRE